MPSGMQSQMPSIVGMPQMPNMQGLPGIPGMPQIGQMGGGPGMVGGFNNMP